ncbi:MAG: metallophosphoesterase [Gemmobacter sp.]|nr:metallophosphoesterase [Gemmobacter sp.]
MTRFIHLTDLHLSHPSRNDPQMKTDTSGALTRAVAAINAMDPLPDFVVCSGDLTNQGDPESYGLLDELLAPLRVPVLLALGNHDKREAFHVTRDRTGDAPYVHETVLAGLHVITLDTLVPGRVAGAIDEGQFDWLAGALDNHAGLPKLIVLHHPPCVDPDGLPWAALDMASTDRLAGLVQGRGVIGMLSGHIHMNRVSLWHGIPLVVSIGLNSTVDLLERSDMRIVEGTGFCICTLRDSGLTVTFAPMTPEPRLLGVIDQARLRAFS